MIALKPVCIKTVGGIPLMAIILLLGKCTRQTAINTTVEPKHFSIQIPFKIDSKGIIISTHWGLHKKTYQLYLDNHSPSWINNAIIRDNASVSKSKYFLYRTTTADGKKLEGDVYVCDSISIGRLSFKNVAFYNITRGKDTGKTDGAIGENVMARGIWKIDFKSHLITIASSADSIKGLREASLLPALFTEKAIEIEVGFRNNSIQKVELDLGFNGYIIMPKAAFAYSIAQNKKFSTEKRRFSTPAGEEILESNTVFDSIRVNHQYFGALISTNKLVEEKLMGLAFFNRFEFLVIDYINKAVYLSEKRLR